MPTRFNRKEMSAGSNLQRSVPHRKCETALSYLNLYCGDKENPASQGGFGKSLPLTEVAS